MQRGRRLAAASLPAAIFGLTLRLSGLAALAGCAGWSAQRQPMALLYDDGACPATQAPLLLVLLPGIYMPIAELQQHGFVQAVRRRGVAADVLIADTSIGYVRDGSIRDRMQAEVLGAVRGWGYRRTVLAGISLGGFVALATAMDQPGQVEGIVALAPYLGRAELLRAIDRAGGPRAWRHGAQPAADDVEAALWIWLVDAVAARAPGAPWVWLGYGRDDRLALGHRMLASLLPPDAVSVVDGGHDWPPWEALWAQWLERGALPRQCAT